MSSFDPAPEVQTRARQLHYRHALETNSAGWIRCPPNEFPNDAIKLVQQYNKDNTVDEVAKRVRSGGAVVGDLTGGPDLIYIPKTGKIQVPESSIRVLIAVPSLQDHETKDSGGLAAPARISVTKAIHTGEMSETFGWSIGKVWVLTEIEELEVKEGLVGCVIMQYGVTKIEFK